jgi:hypothetical protein
MSHEQNYTFLSCARCCYSIDKLFICLQKRSALDPRKFDEMETLSQKFGSVFATVTKLESLIETYKHFLENVKEL